MNIKSNFIKIIILSLLIIGNVFTIKVNASESTSTPATNIQTNLTTDTPKIEIKTQPAAIQNSKKSYNDFDYSIQQDNTIMITGYHGDDSSVTIPSYINGMPVTTLSGAFNNCKFKTIVIPNTVKRLYTSSFQNCPNLSTISIPSSVEVISPVAFCKCYNLSKINVDNNNPKYTSINGIVYNKDVSKLVIVPYLIDKITIPNTVTCISDDAFSECNNLLSVVFPENVKKFGDRIFTSCKNIESVTILCDNAMISPEGPFWDCNKNLIIYGYKNSTTQEYVNTYNTSEYIDHKLIFKALPSDYKINNNGDTDNSSSSTNNLCNIPLTITVMTISCIIAIASKKKIR